MSISAEGDDRPGAALMLTILAINFFGDSLRDGLDPRVKPRS